jgi:hypothetical protein
LKMVLKSKIFLFKLTEGIDGQEKKLNDFLRHIPKKEIVSVQMTEKFSIIVIYNDPVADIVNKYQDEADKKQDKLNEEYNKSLRNAGFE